jgi:hypothetical protein
LVRNRKWIESHVNKILKRSEYNILLENYISGRGDVIIKIIKVPELPCLNGVQQSKKEKLVGLNMFAAACDLSNGLKINPKMISSSAWTSGRGYIVQSFFILDALREHSKEVYHEFVASFGTEKELIFGPEDIGLVTT